MSKAQAVAILEAERVLQHVGCNGPDCSNGSAWHDFVEQAVIALRDDSLLCDAFNDLSLVCDMKGL